MRLQESELHLMEAMKKWMSQRARSEREFSVQLHHMASALEKQSRPPPAAGLDYISQLNKVRFESDTTLILLIPGVKWVETVACKIPYSGAR